MTPPRTDAPDSAPPTQHERWHALHELEEWLERPMLVLSLVWLALFILEVTRGTSPVREALGGAIWVVFLLDFALRLALAPRRVAYLRANWLVALSLLLPALRVVRVVRVLSVLRAAPVAHGARLVRVVGSLNRGMRALGRAFARRGFGYAATLMLLVTLGGAAGMYAFERDVPGSPLTSYGASLWWTAMVMTTLGSDYFPHTAEGRALCLLLAVFAFATFGYVTATLATYFVGRDAEAPDAEVAGQASVDALAAEVRALGEELRALAARLDARAGPPAA